VSSPTIPDGTVISQTPAAGTPVAPGTSVSFGISTGPEPVPVPNILGQTQGDAEAALIAAHLTLGTVLSANAPTVPHGLVLAPSPAGALTAKPGSKVNITLSLGPVMAAVPNVVGSPRIPAQTTIVTAG